jgi:hypothetical protein
MGLQAASNLHRHSLNERRCFCSRRELMFDTWELHFIRHKNQVVTFQTHAYLALSSLPKLPCQVTVDND